MKTFHVLIGGIMLLLLVGTVSAIGYAPLGVYGVISNEGQPVGGASVTLKAFVDKELVAESNLVLTRDTGQFYSVLTIRDPSTVDVQITIRTEDDVYVQLLKEATGWHDYTLEIDLANENLIIDAPSTPSHRPSTMEFEDDYARIQEGDIDAELIEKYNLVKVPYVPVTEDGLNSEEFTQEKPQKEKPGFVMVPGEATVDVEEEKPFYDAIFTHNSWQLIAVGLLVVFALLIHYLYRR